MLHIEFLLLWFLFCAVLFLPFVFFDFKIKQSKIKIAIYCLLSWILIFLFINYYNKIGLYYVWQSLWSMWIIVDPSMKPEESNVPFFYDINGKILFYMSTSLISFWWLYSVAYYALLRYFFKVIIKNEK